MEWEERGGGHIEEAGSPCLWESEREEGADRQGPPWKQGFKSIFLVSDEASD